MVSAQQSVSVEANLGNVLELLISARVEFFGASNGFRSVADLGARWSQAPPPSLPSSFYLAAIRPDLLAARNWPIAPHVRQQEPSQLATLVAAGEAI